MTKKQLEEMVIKILNEDDTSNVRYYKKELERVSFDSEYTPSIKITSSAGSTKNLNLNKESIPVLINWLKSNLKNAK